MLRIHCMNFFTQKQPLEIYTVVNPDAFIRTW